MVMGGWRDWNNSMEKRTYKSSKKALNKSVLPACLNWLLKAIQLQKKNGVDTYIEGPIKVTKKIYKNKLI